MLFSAPSGLKKSPCVDILCEPSREKQEFASLEIQTFASRILHTHTHLKKRNRKVVTVQEGEVTQQHIRKVSFGAWWGRGVCHEKTQHQLSMATECLSFVLKKFKDANLTVIGFARFAIVGGNLS